jgi:MerR family transcriptional regulator/heat shock protein HspR
MSAQRDADVDPSHAVFAISVAAELVGVGVQTLRLYEQHGLVDPARTSGGTRRYSGADIVRLRHVAGLIEAGLNLAGVAAVLTLETDNARLQALLGVAAHEVGDVDG